jgi:aminodeoxyfutalosine deaminase
VIQCYSADLIHNGTIFLPKNTVVTLSEHGEILDIGQNAHAAVQHLDGLLCPSFINAHCHLELSYLHGKIPKHTGLVSFLQHVNKLNYQPNTDEVLNAISTQDDTMYRNGISAVADICNNTNSVQQKAISKIYYHNFIETFGALPSAAEQRWLQAKQVHKQFSSATITPHACYSISQELFALINQSIKGDKLLSIHNQESQQEDELTIYGTGEFVSMLNSINPNIPTQAHHLTALEYTLSQLPAAQKMLFVHNTFSAQNDVQEAVQKLRETYWCVCPAANMYIEQKINPLYKQLHDLGLCIVVGTDSLASNDKLCMVHELYNLHQYLPDLKIEHTLQWATKNGAQMLGLNDLGEIKVGKKPQLVHISNWQKQDEIPENPSISRI